jgi:hypothetical protein
MGRIITGNIDGIIEYIRSIAEPGKSLTQSKLAFLLRLAVHILLLMWDLDVQYDQQAANEIITEYVHALMEYHVVLYPYYQPNLRTIK